jgi:hypothetical protein
MEQALLENWQSLAVLMFLAIILVIAIVKNFPIRIDWRSENGSLSVKLGAHKDGDED